MGLSHSATRAAVRQHEALWDRMAMNGFGLPDNLIFRLLDIHA